jgi:hypothetical protein
MTSNRGGIISSKNSANKHWLHRNNLAIILELLIQLLASGNAIQILETGQLGKIRRSTIMFRTPFRVPPRRRAADPAAAR